MRQPQPKPPDVWRSWLRPAWIKTVPQAGQLNGETMQVTLHTQSTAEELAAICNRNERQVAACCPCAGFTCPLPDMRCSDVTAAHWRAILQGSDTADPYDLKVDKLRLPTRTTNALHRNRIHTVGKLMEYPASRLVLFWGLGAGGVHDIECALAEHGLALAPEDENAGA